MPAVLRQKITFAEMRAAGVRGLLVTVPITAAAIGPRSAATGGRITFGYLTSSRASPAKPAVSRARM